MYTEIDYQKFANILGVDVNDIKEYDLTWEESEEDDDSGYIYIGDFSEKLKQELALNDIINNISVDFVYVNYSEIKTDEK